MKSLIVLLLMSVPAITQTDNASAQIGLLARHDRTGAYQPSFDGLLKVGRDALAVSYTGTADWIIAERVDLWEKRTSNYKIGLGLQEAIRRAAAGDKQNPWILQTGVAADIQVGRNRVITAVSEGQRLKTEQTGYVLSVGYYRYVGNGFALRAVGLLSHVAAKPGYEVGLGFNYVLPIGRKR